MKNIIIIDIDTERVDEDGNAAVLRLGKPEEFRPNTPEEHKSSLNMDVRSLTEGLVELIHIGSINEYGDKDVYLSEVITRLNEGVKPE